MDDNSASFGDTPTNLQPPVSSLKDLKGKVLSEARNQHGCKFLHQKLQERKPEDIQMIFTDLKGHIGMLMLDEFGSYVIQKLFDVCNEEQMNQMVFSVAADLDLLMSVCLDSRGSQSMMKFVECLSTRNQLSQLIYAFKEIMVELVTHPIGCRVIGHCYEFFDLPAKLAEVFITEFHFSLIYRIYKVIVFFAANSRRDS